MRKTIEILLLLLACLLLYGLLYAGATTNVFAALNLAQTFTALQTFSAGIDLTTLTSAGFVTNDASGNFGTSASPTIRQCTEIWGGSGTSFALQSGDDAVADMGCYNGTGKTWTLTAVTCASDSASNTTTVNPTFGSAGTGTTILSSALTCGSSNAMSSSGTISNASISSGNGIDPGMGGTLTGTHIALNFVYTMAN